MNAIHNVTVIPDEEPDRYTVQVGFWAVCTCPWVGPFRPADNSGEGYSHDQAHRQATDDGEEHEGEQP
jgi:hypothetical protein